MSVSRLLHLVHHEQPVLLLVFQEVEEAFEKINLVFAEKLFGFVGCRLDRGAGNRNGKEDRLAVEK
jgi:hypothetical protein